MARIGGLTVSMLVAAMVSPLAAQQAWPGRAGLEVERCTAASGDGAELLARGAATAGITAINGAVRFRGTETHVQAFQSDRMYPPFIQATNAVEFTFDPSSGVERARTLNPDGTPGQDLVRTPRALLAIRDTLLIPAPRGFRFFESQRPLNPLALLVEWQQGGNVKIVARCTFRDMPRMVLSRGIAGERFYLEARTGLPIKYERIEPHVLWGQVHAEYVYATWWQAGPVMLPIVAVRYVDGVEEFRRDVSLPQGSEPLGKSVPLAEAFPRPLPAPLPDHTATQDGWLTVVPVDTVRVAEHTWLLKTAAYTHAVTMVRDTVYLLDATTAEWRSRADSAWIAKLFPTHKAVTLVVTDLAWPHVAGVRFWAARGATITTHRMSRPFLQGLVDRSWTLNPDELERSRRRTQPVRWVWVDSAASLGGGAIRLSGIDGPSSEGAVMAFMPGSGFLWAGDYVQDPDGPSTYAREVIAAAKRAGFAPTRVAAQHLALTPWEKITAANP
jgi:hypothetical protein